MSAEESENDDSIEVFFEKAQNYRTIHADGFEVAPNPKGVVVVHVYNERLPIPRRAKVSQTGEDTFLEEVIETKSGIFRQVEASIFISTNEIGSLISELERAKTFIENGMQHPEDGLEDE